MSDQCCSNPTAGSEVCELPMTRAQRTPRAMTNCGEKGKPVDGQTVKALLLVTLRRVRNKEYLFCQTPTCPVVYFSTDGVETYTVEQVRERVYQKEPNADDVFVCYCLRHTVGEIRATAVTARAAILDDINAGIQTDQCTCDLRNPQGSCCLGNVRGLIKRLENQAILATPQPVS
ncbi:MAG: copper chaperone Copz family protein [Chloroflexi bacterium]|nr:copper chaperone Copz family protein [Chloroflexota bacterium]